MEDDAPATDKMSGGAPFSDADDGPTAEDTPLANGTDVGGYTIESEIGRGGMGIVYSATHPMIGKRVAIKVIRASLSRDPTAIERFVQEARSVNQIGHPNIVDIFSLGALPDRRCYMVMDLLEGEPLRKRLKRGPLHVREAAAVIDEIASALLSAHDKGFIHRDLKPDNVFLVEHPARTDVRLLDFGIAKLLPGSTGGRVFRTATGVQLGTPDYMAPEQLRGGRVDHRVDIFSLGVMAYETLAGRRPRRALDGGLALGGKTCAQWLVTVPHVPGDLADLIETMVAVDPDGRPSLAAIRAVMKRLRGALPPASVPGLQKALPDPEGDEDDGAFGVDSISASDLGASAVVPPLVTAVEKRRPGPSMPPESVPVPVPVSLPAASPATSGLAHANAAPLHPGTTLGVPPPPAQLAPRHAPIPSVAPAPAPPTAAPRRTWFAIVVIVGLVVLAAGVALAVLLGR